LKCSLYRLQQNQQKRRPLIIALHCNGGCRLEHSNKIDPALENGFNLLTFDYSGSGISGGDYVSLGWYESIDVECVVRWARK